jgi:hypothetical protein
MPGVGLKIIKIVKIIKVIKIIKSLRDTVSPGGKLPYSDDGRGRCVRGEQESKRRLA